MENKTKLRVACYAGIALFLVLFTRHCDKQREIKLSSTWAPNKTIPPAYQLKPEEKAKIIVDTDNRRVTVVSPNKIQTFEGVRQATITEKKDGSVQLAAKEYGWCIEPGIGVMVSDHVGVAADVQFAYWKMLGATIGARLWPAPSPFVAVSYNLAGIHLPNTSVYVGDDLMRRYLCVGIRARI